MAFISDENRDLNILVPESLLASGAIQSWSEKGQNGLPYHRVSSSPADEVTVTKSRQTPIELVIDAEPHSHRNGAQLDETRRPAQETDFQTPVPARTAGHVFQKRSSNDSQWSEYNLASLVDIRHRRKYWYRKLFEYGLYIVLTLFSYLFLIGQPLWKGAVYWLYCLMKKKAIFQGGWALFIVLLTVSSYMPLLIPFEKEAPMPLSYHRSYINARAVPKTALLIPCHRSASFIGRTIEAALNIFPASQIYVVANGDSPEPLDNTAAVCAEYGVNHIWCPVASKIVALFVGSYAIRKRYNYILLIDDDCILPRNFPLATSRITEQVRCIGYTIKSVGAGSTIGSYCQQAQDLEYKLSGLQRSFAGRIGSTTFPHGAISLWERSFLKSLLGHHPGFAISEDWFMGHSCRSLGGRIQMCSSVFVETTTPATLFLKDSRNQATKRGGFGERTVCQQRFSRWNFFSVYCLRYNLTYIICSWKLGKWELGAKIFVWQEVYETILSLLIPFALPISLLVRPWFFVGLMIVTLAICLLQIILFNEVHLRPRNEHVGWSIIGYFILYKLSLNLVNVAGCYWSLVKYAHYFAKGRPKVTENHKAVGLVLELAKVETHRQFDCSDLSRHLTFRAVGVHKSLDANITELPV